MKKKGFTLAEFLVALGIVGIITAIAIPSINRILPDKDKGTVLKVYKTINEINSEIFNNPSLYMFNTSCEAPHILRCSSVPLDENHRTPSYEGYNKYPSLLLEHLTLADPNVTVSNGKCSFTTSDGTGWTIDLNIYDAGNLVPDSYTIQIDTNRSGRQDCMYNSTCTNPRQFKFIVNSNGELKATDDDYLTQAFLLNPDELNSRSADLRKAAALASSASSGESSESSSQ